MATSEVRSALQEIEDALVFLYRGPRAGQVHALLNKLAGVSLDRPSFVALMALAERESTRLSDLAETCGLDISTMSRQVNRLIGEGLVESRVASHDRRTLLLQLSEQGEATVDKLRTARREALSRVMGEWTEMEREDFARLLSRFTDACRVLQIEAAAEVSKAEGGLRE